MYRGSIGHNSNYTIIIVISQLCYGGYSISLDSLCLKEAIAVPIVQQEVIGERGSQAKQYQNSSLKNSNSTNLIYAMKNPVSLF